MCVSCVTAVDTAATNSVLLLAVAANGWERVRDRWAGRTRLERQVTTWNQNADFMRSLGLDPLGTLGAPPAIPAEDPQPVDR